MDRWDLLIIGVAGYVAIVTLVRLMTARRNELVEQVRQQVVEQRNQQINQQANQAVSEESDRPAA